MDDPQEYKSLDELFRKTFDELPNQAAASGWDAPSPRVWDQVRDQIQTPKSGWTGKSILLISSLAIVLMLGLYWAFSSSATTEITEPSTAETSAAASAQTSTQVLEEETSTALSTAQQASTSAQPKSQTKANTQGQAKSAETTEAPSSNTQQEEDGVRRRLPGSAPLPGTNHASPNTTIRRQMEIWRGAPWAQPLAPVPSILESEFIRPVPESLKRLGN